MDEKGRTQDQEARDKRLNAQSNSEYDPRLEVLHNFNQLCEDKEKEKSAKQCNKGKRKASKKLPKKVKQPTLKKGFALPKAQKQRDVKNYQGFSMKDCFRLQETNTYVFIPEHNSMLYDQLGNKLAPSQMWQNQFCKECMLSPCMVDKCEYHICEAATDLVYSTLPIYPTNKEMNLAARDWAFLYFKGLFGEKYANKVGEPHCFSRKIGHLLSQTDQNQEESDSEDETQWSLDGICCAQDEQAIQEESE